LQADKHHAPSATRSILLIHPVTESEVGILLAKKEEVETQEAKKEEVIGDWIILQRDMFLNFTPTHINWGEKERKTWPEHVAQLGHVRNVHNFRLET